MFTLRKVVISLITLLFLLSVFALILDYWMGWKTEKSIYTEISAIPAKNVGVVLGTAKYLVAGGINQYYQNRIDGAVDLYNAGKINYILVSGDNAQNSYNEPRVMRLDLIEAGIPKEKIVLDFAGFRTLDSVLTKSLSRMISPSLRSSSTVNARSLSRNIWAFMHNVLLLHYQKIDSMG